MFVKLLDRCKQVNARYVEGIFYEFKISLKSERFLRVEEFYSEKILDHT
jgi:hypothetical protein